MYYDYNGNRVHLIWRFLDGYYKNAFHQLELEESGQDWIWLGDGASYTPTTIDDELSFCWMNKSSINITGWDYLTPVENGHIMNPSRFWLFDDHDNDPQISDETWMGYDTIRSIPAEKWKAYVNIAVNSNDRSYLLPYLGLPENQRVVLNGTITFSYNIIYIHFICNFVYTYMNNMMYNNN